MKDICPHFDQGRSKDSTDVGAWGTGGAGKHVLLSVPDMYLQSAFMQLFNMFCLFVRVHDRAISLLKNCIEYNCE